MSAQGISREDVADLKPGDTVNVRRIDWPTATTGELWEDQQGNLMHGGCTVRLADGEPSQFLYRLDVVHRSTPPYYVNHPRTEPVAGDVAKPVDQDLMFVCLATGEWLDQDGDEWHNPPKPMRLWVDGQTDRVVQ